MQVGYDSNFQSQIYVIGQSSYADMGEWDLTIMATNADGSTEFYKTEIKVSPSWLDVVGIILIILVVIFFFVFLWLLRSPFWNCFCCCLRKHHRAKINEEINNFRVLDEGCPNYFFNRSYVGDDEKRRFLLRTYVDRIEVYGLSKSEEVKMCPGMSRHFGPLFETHVTYLVKALISLDAQDFVLKVDTEGVMKALGNTFPDIAIYVYDHNGKKLERIAVSMGDIKKTQKVERMVSETDKDKYTTLINDE